MNSNFNFKRFCRLVEYDLGGKTHKILIYFPLSVLAVMSLFALILRDTYDMSERLMIIRNFVALGAFFLPEAVYGRCNLKDEGIPFAMLPASKIEKLFSMLLVCIVISPAIILASCLIGDSLLVALNFPGCDDYIFKSLAQELDFVALAAFAAAVMFFVLMNTFFKKYKTAIGMLIFSFLLLPGLLFAFRIIKRLSQGESIHSDFIHSLMPYAPYIKVIVPVVFVFAAIGFACWTGARLKKMRY